MGEGWLELTVTVPLEATEAVAEVLRRYAPSGIAIEEPFLPLDDDGAFALDPSRPARVRAYLRLEDQAPEVRRRLRAELAQVPWPTCFRTRRLSESALERWAEAWKAHFRIERVGRRLVVCPSWIEYAPSESELVIRLDPGMTFGTGQHPTTRLCLRALEDYLRPGARVLDVGTGSGILAIAAALLGAAAVTALDTDAIAVEAARANAQVNGVGQQVTVALGSLGDAWPPPEPPPAFDIVVANISTAFVLENAAALLATTAPTGVLIVSGVPEERRPEAEAALVAADGRIVEGPAGGGWCALVAKTVALSAATRRGEALAPPHGPT